MTMDWSYFYELIFIYIYIYNDAELKLFAEVLVPQKKLKRCLCVHACEHHKWAPIHIVLNLIVHEHT